MTSVRQSVVGVILSAALLLPIFGCAPRSLQTHPLMTEKCREIRSVALAGPEVKAYEISAGGMPELMPEWSRVASENVAKAVAATLGQNGVKVSPLRTDEETERELKEVLALFSAVSATIMSNRTPVQPGLTPSAPTPFGKNADYSVGSLEKVLKSSGADGLLLVYGVDQFATSAKKAVNVLGTISGVMVSAVTGVVVVPRGEGTTLRVALVDRNGTVIWHNTRFGSSDLRSPDGSAYFVEEALRDFPRLSQ